VADEFKVDVAFTQRRSLGGKSCSTFGCLAGDVTGVRSPWRKLRWGNT